MNGFKRSIFLLLGPLLFLMSCFLLPNNVFHSMESKAAIGTIIWMALWWVSGAVDYAVTAFLPIIINCIVPIAEMSLVIANYASETILLLLGASILTVSWQETGLDKRIAAKVLSVVGSNFRQQLVFWFLLSVILSAVLPNAVVCATITPIAVSMLRYIGENDIAHSKSGSKLLLTIVYAAGLGGLATPLGGAMNLVTVNYLQEFTNQEYMYVSWVVRFLPIMLVLIISNIWFMLRDVKKTEVLGGSKEYFIEEYRRMKKMKFDEKSALVIFVIAVLLSFTRQFYQTALPGLKPAYVFLSCAVLSFLIVRKDNQNVMKWKFVQTKIVWDLIYIFAGGLAAGTLMNNSGAANDIGQYVAGLGLSGGIGTVFVIITVTLLLSDITSNTATATIAMPIVISIVQGIGENPIPYIYIASIGVNLSYMLPTSIRAIPVGYGLLPKYMLKEGWKISVMVIVLTTVLSYLLLRCWTLFSTI